MVRAAHRAYLQRRVRGLLAGSGVKISACHRALPTGAVRPGPRRLDLSGRLDVVMINLGTVGTCHNPDVSPASDPPASDPPASDPPASDPPASEPSAADPVSPSQVDPDLPLRTVRAIEVAAVFATLVTSIAIAFRIDTPLEIWSIALFGVSVPGSAPLFAQPFDVERPGLVQPALAPLLDDPVPVRAVRPSTSPG
jgi:hypothetical protein